jgi:hypothetical protein
MIITKDELFPKRLLPGTEDRRIAARTCSFFSWMAALWFFVSPWAYFGVSDERSAWNAWIVGAVMVLASMVRMIQPRGTTGFSMANAVLSVWVLISPFVFGYAGQTAHLVNTLTIGSVILSCSVLSAMVSRDVDTRIGTPDVAIREDPQAASLRRRA